MTQNDKNKNVTVHKNEVTGDYYFPMEAFKNLVDIEKVAYYSVEEENGGMVITFYDKDRNKLEIKDKGEK